MPKRFRLNRPDLAPAVANALPHSQNLHAQQRLLAMRLASSGQFTAIQIAEQIGISWRQFFHWVNALKSGGVAKLLQRHHAGGRAAQVRGAVLTELQDGLRVGRWKRAKEIQQWLAQRHHKKMQLSGVYYWLGKLGGVLKVPRKTHAHKDAAAASEFQQTLCAKLKSLNVVGGKRVRVWVADEHR